MRRAAKVDANHGDIVKALRAAGCRVQSTAAVGGGFPDLVVQRAGITHLVEVKNPEEWRGRLEPLQQQRLEEGWVFSVVTNKYEALHAVGVCHEKAV